MGGMGCLSGSTSSFRVVLEDARDSRLRHAETRRELWGDGGGATGAGDVVQSVRVVWCSRCGWCGGVGAGGVVRSVRVVWGGRCGWCGVAGTDGVGWTVRVVARGG